MITQPIPFNRTHVPHGEALSPYYYRTFTAIKAARPPGFWVAVGFVQESEAWYVHSVEEWLRVCGRNPAAAFTCFIAREFGPASEGDPDVIYR